MMFFELEYFVKKVIVIKTVHEKGLKTKQKVFRSALHFTSA